MEIIKANGERIHDEPRLRRLEELQEAVGGCLEHIQLPGGRHLLCDEDGKMKGRPRNGYATEEFAEVAGLRSYDCFVGDIVILEPDEME